jgi:hypothetical protein
MAMAYLVRTKDSELCMLRPLSGVVSSLSVLSWSGTRHAVMVAFYMGRPSFKGACCNLGMTTMRQGPETHLSTVIGNLTVFGSSDP